jgi:hypothetical protein
LWVWGWGFNSWYAPIVSEWDTPCVSGFKWARDCEHHRVPFYLLLKEKEKKKIKEVDVFFTCFFWKKVRWKKVNKSHLKEGLIHWTKSFEYINNSLLRMIWWSFSTFSVSFPKWCKSLILLERKCLVILYAFNVWLSFGQRGGIILTNVKYRRLYLLCSRYTAWFSQASGTHSYTADIGNHFSKYRGC